MKKVFLRVFLGFAILDLMLGMVIAVGILLDIARPKAWAGAGALIVFGAWGIVWTLRALLARPREVNP